MSCRHRQRSARPPGLIALALSALVLLAAGCGRLEQSSKAADDTGPEREPAPASKPASQTAAAAERIPDALVRQARSLLAEGKPAEAEKQLQDVLRREPQHAEALGELAYLRQAQGRPRQAIEAYRRALAARPSWPRAANNLAWLLATSPDAALRDASQAVALAEQSLKESGEGEPGYLDTLAAAYAEAGCSDGAVRVARSAIEKLRSPAVADVRLQIEERLRLYANSLPYRDPTLAGGPIAASPVEEAIALTCRGRQLAQAGQPEAALAAYQRALALWPESREASLALATLLASKPRDDWRAPPPQKKLLNLAGRIDPREDPFQLVAWSAALATSERPQAAANFAALAARALDDQGFARAAGRTVAWGRHARHPRRAEERIDFVLEDLVFRHFPDASDRARVLERLAGLLATQEDPRLRAPETAVRLAERACGAGATAASLDTLAAAYAAAGRFADAVEVADRALTRAGDAAMRGRLAEHRRLFQRRLALVESFAPAWLADSLTEQAADDARVARALFVLAAERPEADDEAARGALVASLRLDPAFVRPYVALGRRLIEQGRVGRAAGYLRAGALLEPEDATALGYLAEARMAQGREFEAVGLYERALARRPDWLHALNNLAWSLAVSENALVRDPDRAVELARRACDLAGGPNPKLRDTLGVAYAAAGDFARAREAAERAIEEARRPGFAELRNGLELRLRLYGLEEPYRSDARMHLVLGRSLLARGRLKEAEEHLLRATELAPEDPRAFFHLGQAYQRQGRLDKSGESFARARERRPDWDLPLNALAWLLATHHDPQRRRPGEAIKLAEKLCGASKKPNVRFLTTLAAAYASGGRFDDAVAAQSEALERFEHEGDPAGADAARERLRLYRAGKPLRQSGGSLVARFLPDEPAASRRLSPKELDHFLLRELRQVADMPNGLIARDEVLRILATHEDPQVRDARFAMSLARKLGAAQDGAALNEELLAGLPDGRRGPDGRRKTVWAAQRFEEQATSEATDRPAPGARQRAMARVFRLAGRRLAERKLLEVAEAVYRDSLLLDAASLEARLEAASVLEEQGKLDDARGHLLLALKVNPRDAHVVRRLGYLSERSGRPEEAALFYAEVLRLRPADVGVMNNLAWIMATLEEPAYRDPGFAVLLAEDACRLTDHRSPYLLDTLAVAYAADERYDDAIRAGERALEIAEERDEGRLFDSTARESIRARLELYRHGVAFRGRRQMLLELARIDAERGDHSGAIRHLREALALSPEDVELLNELGTLLLAERRLTEAFQMFSRSLLQQPRSAEILNNLAWILTFHDDPRIHRPDVAVGLAQQACELSEFSSVECLDTLAAAQWANGRSGEALESLEQALDLLDAKPASEEADAAHRERLRQVLLDRRERIRAARPGAGG